MGGDAQASANPYKSKELGVCLDTLPKDSTEFSRAQVLDLEENVKRRGGFLSIRRGGKRPLRRNEAGNLPKFRALRKKRMECDGTDTQSGRNPPRENKIFKKIGKARSARLQKRVISSR